SRSTGGSSRSTGGSSRSTGGSSRSTGSSSRSTGSFVEVAAQLAEIHRELGLVKSVAIDHGRQLREIRKTVESIETKVDAKVDRSEVVAIVEAAISRRR